MRRSGVLRSSFLGKPMNAPFFATLLLMLFVGIFGGCAPDHCQNSFSGPPNPSAIGDGLGVNIHFTDPRPGEIKMLADAGVRWVRMDFKWDATERAKGEYDFSAYDRLMSALTPYKIRPLFILDYGNPLYDGGGPPRSDEARRAFARWAVAAAKHFAGHGVVWETYNEPNLKQFWQPGPNVDEYVALALAVGRALRSAVPNERLIGPGTSGVDFPFLEACFKAGLLNYWSAVSVHPYRQSDPETAADDYCRLRKMIASYAPGKQIEIISSEWGYSDIWRGMTEQKQSEYLARAMLTNAANGISISIWYDWRNDGADPNEAEHHFGLVRNEYQPDRDQVFRPKPAYLAAQTLNAKLGGYRFERRIAVGNDNDYVFIFTRARETRIAAWTTTSTSHRIVIPFGEGQFRVSLVTGESAGSVTAGPQGLTVEISTSPIYLSR
jgi:polysaccharide biosynthesis protein PslG